MNIFKRKDNNAEKRVTPRVTVTRDYAIIVNMDDVVKSEEYKKQVEAVKELEKLVKAAKNNSE